MTCLTSPQLGWITLSLSSLRYRHFLVSTVYLKNIEKLLSRPKSFFPSILQHRPPYDGDDLVVRRPFVLVEPAEEQDVQADSHLRRIFTSVKDTGL